MLDLRLGDCLQLLKEIPDKSVDLVLTDPPYGIGEAAGKNKSRGLLAVSKDYGNASWDNERITGFVPHVLRVAKHAIIFGGNYYADLLPPSSCWLVWDKDNGATDFADCELAWTNFPTAVRRFKWRWQGMLQEDMGRKEERVHPTQKPVALMEWILTKYTSEGDTVLDCFMGSCSTGVACVRLNRNFIGMEIDPHWFEVAQMRIKEAQTGVSVKEQQMGMRGLYD